MNINSTYKILDELGLKISDYKLFGEFVRNNNNSYEEAIDIIRKSKSVKDKKINYTDFEKRMVGYFKEIQRLINKDSLFVFSNEEDKDNFKKYFQSIIDKYIIIYKLKDDKDNCKKKADEIVELKNEIDKINNNYIGGNDYGKPDRKPEGLYDRNLPPRVRYSKPDDDSGNL